ncbi:MAG: type II secretion system protein GspC [Kangiellaceae bacterium]|nr:type II secretion system protein GspC [Kangiellaceae bacterium]
MNSTSDKFNQFVQQRGRLIAQILAAILALVTLFIIAKLVWLWVEHLQPKAPAQAVVIPTQKPKENVNVNKLVAMHIFGEANAVPEPEQVQAEETRLNLKLMGTFVSRNLELSSAIILSNGSKEKAYFVGDKLEVSGNVTLHQVETQKVIIKNGGRYETLTLIENINESMVSAPTPNLQETNDAATRTIDKRRDSRLTQDLGELREKLYTSPQSLAGLAQFERVVDESGMVSGYKVAPGKDPRMFARLGLRRNDVIKSVNGSPLNEQGYLGIIEELNSSESLEVTIERNGQPVTLLLGLGAANAQNDGQQRTNNQRLNNEIK